MADELSRRFFMVSASRVAAGACIGTSLLGRKPLALQGGPPDRAPHPATTILRAETRWIEINGKAAKMMGVRQPNGTLGLSSSVNQPFKVLLENQLAVPTAMHWHGLHPPNDQDGVPGLTQPPIQPGAAMHYDFSLRPAGTHWMHSHLGLQEAFLLSAPLIVHDPLQDHSQNEREIVLFLGDFSFTPPNELYAKLRRPPKSPMPMGGKMGMPAKGAPFRMKMGGGRPDANDLNYDAYLANDRTLADPEIVRVESGEPVRLRIINGSSGTNYFVDLGELSGELVATDGMPVMPIRGSRFPLAIAQRIDIRIEVPRGGGAFPILGLREGAMERTGIVLATKGTSVVRVPGHGAAPAGLLTLALESRLAAVNPLAPKAVDQTNILRLQGNMSKYEWTINGHAFDTENPGTEKAQVHVKRGQRVALAFVNETGMSHPMHLHGHSFQVVDINGKAFQGALRDSVLVPPATTVKVVFDADNPGTWYVHCHVLWHLAAGMATLVQYDA